MIECIICHQLIEYDRRCNPEPLFNNVDDWCCEMCDNDIILPIRLILKEK